MKVPDNKEVANHAVPESCAVLREEYGEALTGVRVGQPLSHDRVFIPDADVLQYAEGHTQRRVSASASAIRRGRRPWHVRKLFVREPGGLGFGLRRDAAGPYREDEES